MEELICWLISSLHVISTLHPIPGVLIACIPHSLASNLELLLVTTIISLKITTWIPSTNQQTHTHINNPSWISHSQEVIEPGCLWPISFVCVKYILKPQSWLCLSNSWESRVSKYLLKRLSKIWAHFLQMSLCFIFKNASVRITLITFLWHLSLSEIWLLAIWSWSRGARLKSQNVNYMLAPLRSQDPLPQALDHAFPVSLWGLNSLWYMSSRCPHQFWGGGGPGS